MQFEQTQPSWPRKEHPGTDSDSSASLHNGSHASSHGSSGFSEHLPSIPVNKEGKRYTMKQAFSVWFDHQEQISETSAAVKTGENYKLAQPQQIYHLDFNHGPLDGDFSVSKDASDVSLPAEIGAQNGAENGAERSPQAPPNLTKSASHAQENAPEPSPVLVQPENISWIYLDPAGNEQGPFSGDIMQEWLSDGYLSLDLRIRRKEETRFQTLKQFCEAVQNFIQPFKVPLTSVPSDPAQMPMPGAFQPQISDPPVAENNGYAFQNGTHQQPFSGNLYSQLLPNGGLGAANIRTPSANALFDFMGPDYPLMNSQYSGAQFGLDNRNANMGFGQLHMPSLLQQQISSQPSLSRSNSGWGMDNSLQGSLPSTPTTAAPVPLGIGQSIQSLGQSGSISPWINRVQPMSRVSSPFVPASGLATDPVEKAEDNLLQDIHSSMVSGILSEDRGMDRGLATDLMGFSEKAPAMPVSQPVADTVAESAPEPVAATEPKEAPATAAQNADAKPSPLESQTTPESDPETVTTILAALPEKEKEDPARVSAPWAISKAKQDAPPLTLKQIQELEAERLQREKQLKAEMRQEIALANALAASKLDEKVPEKVTFNWATSSQPVAKKSLAEIQREEEAEAAKSRATKTSTPSGSKISLASALASTPVREDGGAWTTVSSKKPALKKQASTPQGISYSTLSGSINPQVLRNASSGHVTATATNAHAVKEDFLVWARSAMTNLYPSVSKNDLLEVFTTLPLLGDSAQLIAETIYSSSATMDGRRFAQEFMKKRQQVEKQVGPSAPDSWSSAIVTSADKVPTMDDDGWSTSGKSKKKGRKN